MRNGIWKKILLLYVSLLALLDHITDKLQYCLMEISVKHLVELQVILLLCIFHQYSLFCDV